MPITTPYVTGSAVPTGVDAVASFPSTVYPRRLIGLSVGGPRGSSVRIYLGSVAPSSLLDQSANGWGNSAEYSNPRPVPSGVPIFVVWPNQAANYGQCVATLHFGE